MHYKIMTSFFLKLNPALKKIGHINYPYHNDFFMYIETLFWGILSNNVESVKSQDDKSWQQRLTATLNDGCPIGHISSNKKDSQNDIWKHGVLNIES